jgi:hypothetical protein
VLGGGLTPELSVHRGILDRDGGPMGIEHKINREGHKEKFYLKI